MPFSKSTPSLVTTSPKGALGTCSGCGLRRPVPPLATASWGRELQRPRPQPDSLTLQAGRGRMGFPQQTARVVGKRLHAILKPASIPLPHRPANSESVGTRSASHNTRVQCPLRITHTPAAPTPSFVSERHSRALQSRPDAESIMVSSWRGLRWQGELTSFSNSWWTSDWSARTRTDKPCAAHCALVSSDSRRDPVGCGLCLTTTR